MFLEVGAEELPANAVGSALLYMKEALAKLLEDAQLGHGTVHSAGTPRRLAVWVDAAERQEDREEARLGPAASVAFD